MTPQRDLKCLVASQLTILADDTYNVGIYRHGM
jgi:hypothetical protein